MNEDTPIGNRQETQFPTIATNEAQEHLIDISSQGVEEENILTVAETTKPETELLFPTVLTKGEQELLLYINKLTGKGYGQILSEIHQQFDAWPDDHISEHFLNFKRASETGVTPTGKNESALWKNEHEERLRQMNEEHPVPDKKQTLVSMIKRVFTSKAA